MQTSTFVEITLKFQAPQSVSKRNQLEENVVNILKTINVDITSNEIETYYRLSKKKKDVIIRVINRKHCLQELRNKKQLKFSDKTALGIPNPNEKLFITEAATGGVL